MPQWYPELLQRGDGISSAATGGEAVIVLNGNHEQDSKAFPARWTAAALKVSVDGGTNFVYDTLGMDRCFWPDVITGDFDSVRPDVQQFYKDKQIPVHYTEDQNYTDFFKSLKIVANMCKDGSKNISRIIVFGAYGGRLDHVFGNVSSLVQAQDITDIPICLLDDRQQAFLLTRGEHEIHVDDPDAVEWCALVPVIQPVISTTTGLKWDLEGHSMAVGGLISTSNKISTELVKVKCDGMLLWMMGY